MDVVAEDAPVLVEGVAVAETVETAAVEAAVAAVGRMGNVMFFSAGDGDGRLGV